MVLEDVVVQLVEEEAAGAEMKIKVIQRERQQAPVAEVEEHFLVLEDLVEKLVHQTPVEVEEVLLAAVVEEAVVGVLLVVAPVEAAVVAVVEPYIDTEEVFHTTTIDFMDQ